jgi:hypothetical protein
MPVTRLIEKALPVVINFLEGHLFLGLQRKQNSVALSTVEAECISSGSYCAQLLWMKQILLDFGVKFTDILFLCDNESTVKIATNPVPHSRTKHIDIQHHSLRDHVIM